MKLTDIYVRDPFILPHDGKYYLYKSDYPCIKVHISEDLEEWSEAKPVFTRPDGFWSDRDFWAPEVHEYKGNFYLFVSFKSEDRCRGTQILRSASPDGPFEPISDYPQTPADWEALDGTLWIEDGKPYMVFAHEWLQIADGTMAYVPLSDDLSAPIGEAVTMFKASDAPFANPVSSKSAQEKLGTDGLYVTDAPWMYRSPDGRLHMLWATFGPWGYTETSAVSSNGRLDGEWTQEEPLYKGDGGHAMVFKSFDGKLYLSLHSPNSGGLERAHFIELEETETGYKVKE